MKCPNPACDYSPEPTDWCCEACGTVLGAAAQSQVVSAADAAPSGCACTTFDVDGYCEGCGRKRDIRPGPSRLELSKLLALVSDIGMKHHVNQDAALVAQLDNGVLIVVADGVSTAENSEAASALVTATIASEMAKATDGDAGALLKAAVVKADNAVRAMPYSGREDLAEPQTTVVAALVRGRDVWLSWVGDSRAYELGVTSRQLTVDDSWYESAVAQGMPREVAQADRRAHAITQCLGMRDELPEVNLTSTTLGEGSTLLLCTDGLWNYFEDPAALQGLMAQGSADDSALTIAQRMVDAANHAGGRDNISVGLLKGVV